MKITRDEARRIYSCDYVYAHGAKVTLSVRQASSLAETTAYFESLAKHLGKTRSLFGTGDGYLLALNHALHTWGKPIYVRPFPEMNGHWNPWCAYNANGSSRRASCQAGTAVPIWPISNSTMPRWSAWPRR